MSAFLKSLKACRTAVTVITGIVVVTGATWMVVHAYINHSKAEASVGDRRQISRTMLKALNEYLADHGEYPPYLLGGGKTCGWPPGMAATGGAFEPPVPAGTPSPDPLIQEGYLQEYSKTTPAMSDEVVNLLLSDPRNANRWICLVSTPDDPVEEWWKKLVHQFDQRKPVESGQFDVGKQRRRVLALGGVLLHFPNGEQRFAYDVGIGAANNALTHFGYQRGEWLGRSSREAWLWFYGDNAYFEMASPRLGSEEFNRSFGLPTGNELLDERLILQGLDILNAETGELEPDGIPDGICILFELKDGEIASVRYDSELITPLAAWLEHAD